MFLDLLVGHFGKVMTAFIVSIIWISAELSEASCHAMTDGMGFNVEWTILGGCKIEHKEGKWIPLNRYRVED